MNNPSLVLAAAFRRQWTLVALWPLAIALPICAGSQTLTIQGSDSLLALSQKWAEAYNTSHPGTTLQAAGGGAPTAFAAVAAKKVDLALTSRPIRYKEAEAFVTTFGKRPIEYKLAVNGLAIYVNASNSVMALTYDELNSIYTGQRTNWKSFDGGVDAPIRASALDTNSVQGELFVEEVLNGNPWPKQVRLVSAMEMLKAVATDPAAIGFGPLVQHDGLRLMTLKRVFSSTPVAPTDEAITKRLYPLSRFVYGYVNPDNPSKEIKAYLDWLRADEGQQVAKDAGYYPIPAKWRASP